MHIYIRHRSIVLLQNTLKIYTPVIIYLLLPQKKMIVYTNRVWINSASAARRTSQKFTTSCGVDQFKFSKHSCVSAVEMRAHTPGTSRRHRHRHHRRCRLRAHDVNNRLLINCLTAQVELTMANLWFVTPPGGKPALLRGGCAGIAGVAACGGWRYVHRGAEGWTGDRGGGWGGWTGGWGWSARLKEDERRRWWWTRDAGGLATPSARSFRPCNPPNANTELISRELAPPFHPPRRLWNGNERADASALSVLRSPIVFSTPRPSFLSSLLRYRILSLFFSFPSLFSFLRIFRLWFDVSIVSLHSCVSLAYPDFRCFSFSFCAYECHFLTEKNLLFSFLRFSSL